MPVCKTGVRRVIRIEFENSLLFYFGRILDFDDISFDCLIRLSFSVVIVGFFALSILKFIFIFGMISHLLSRLYCLFSNFFNYFFVFIECFSE